MIAVSRDQKRMWRNDIGNGAGIVVAAWCERFGIDEAGVLYELQKMQKGKERQGKIDEMKQDIADFDAGLIIPDDKADNE